MSAATSDLAIANMALSHLGADSRIESMLEKSTEARAMKQWYNVCRLETLERFDWSFARKRLALALHSEDPPEGAWNYRYQYPADCVSFRRLRNPLGEQQDPVPFQEETAPDGTRSIVTNLEDAVGIYTYDCTSTLVFPATFVTALSHNLAFRTGFQITKKQSIANAQGQLYDGLFRRASGQNANAAAAEPPRDAERIRGR